MEYNAKLNYNQTKYNVTFNAQQLYDINIDNQTKELEKIYEMVTTPSWE